MKLEFHEQTEVDMIIPPSPPVLCTFDEGWQGQILNDVFPLLQTLEPRGQREVERFVTSYKLSVGS